MVDIDKSQNELCKKANTNIAAGSAEARQLSEVFFVGTAPRANGSPLGN